MAHVAVVGCEVTFLLGALNLVVSRMKGESPGAPAILGGLLGVLMVGWSNVSAGWEYGITGILLGLATPAALVISEAILSRAILQHSKKEEATPSQVEEEREATEIHSSNTVEPVEEMESYPSSVQEAMEEVATTAEEAEENSSKVESQDSNVLEETPNNAGESSQPEEKDSSKLEESPTDREELEENSPRTPLEWAWYLYKQKGKLPTRREIMEKAGCKEWPARTARKEVEKRINSEGEPVGNPT